MRESSRFSSKARKRITYFIGMIGVAVWFATVPFERHLIATRPGVPNPDTGQTYSLNSHGSIVYLTSAESLQFHAIKVIGFFLLVLGMSLYAYWYAADDRLNKELLRRNRDA